MSERAGSYLSIGAAIFAVISVMFLSRAFAGVLLGFAIGVLICTYFPGLERWVRAAGDWVRGFVAGTGRKPAAPARAMAMYAVPPPTQQAPLGPSVAAQWAKFAQGALNWADFILRRPILVIGVLLILVWFAFASGCVRLPQWLHESREHAIARANSADAHIETQRQATHAGALEGQRFNHTATVIDRALDDGREQLESHAREDDLAFLRAWRDADQRVLDAGSARR